MPIVATVLKSGGEFTVDHLSHFVRELALFTQKWTRRNNFVPPRLVCLTDLDPETLPAGVEAIAMVDAWPEPWTVLELFKPGLFDEDEAILYFRLDVELVGDFLSVFDAVDAIEIHRLRPATGDALAATLTETALVVDMIIATASDALSVAVPGVGTIPEDVLALTGSDHTDLTLVEGEVEALLGGDDDTLIGDDDTLLADDAAMTLDVAVTVTDHATVDEATLLLFATLARADNPSATLAELAAIFATVSGTDTPTAAIVDAVSAFRKLLTRTDAPTVAIGQSATLVTHTGEFPYAVVTLAEIALPSARTDTPTLALTESAAVVTHEGEFPYAAVTWAEVGLPKS